MRASTGWLDRQTPRLALPLLLLLVAALFAPFLLFGQNFFYTDTFNFFYPLKKTVVDILKSGVLPHWNPLSAGGKPLIGGLQSGVFYPGNVVLLVLPWPRAYAVFTVMHYLIAAGLMYRLGRRLGLGPWPAVFAGGAYALSGHLVSMQNSVSIVMVAAWLPLQVELALRLLETGRASTLAGLVLVTAVAFLAGAPVTFAYCAGTTWLLLAAGIVRRARAGEPWRGRALLAVVFPVLVLGVVAVQFLPAAEFGGHSTRAEGVPYEDAARHSLHPLRLVTLFAPFVFGNPAKGLLPDIPVAPQIVILITIYMGIGPLLLAPLGVGDRARGGLFWGGAVAVSLVVALGDHVKVYRLLYEVVPFFGQLRSPFKALVITTFATSLLAGLGLQRITSEDADRPPTRMAGAVVAALGLAFVVLGGLALWRIGAAAGGVPAALEVMRGTAVRQILFAAPIFIVSAVLVVAAARGQVRRGAALALILGLFVADVGRSVTASSPMWSDAEYANPPPTAARIARAAPWGPPTRTYRTPPDDTAGLGRYVTGDLLSFYAMRRELLAPNLGTAWQLDQFDSYESAVLFWHGKFQNFVERSPPGRRASMLGLVGVDVVISAEPVENPALVPDGLRPNWPQMMSPAVMQNRLAFPRAYVVLDAVEVTDPNGMLETMRDGGTNFRQAVLVSPPGRSEASLREETQKLLPYLRGWRPTAMAHDGVLPDEPVPIPPLQTVAYEPNRVVVTAKTEDAGWLVLNDTYHPGWTATVNGEPVEVRRANYLVRAVPVPAGTSTVVFEYVPRAFRRGLPITIVSLLVVLGLAASGWLLRRGDGGGAPAPASPAAPPPEGDTPV